MMAEKIRRFQDNRAVELIMSSPSPSTRKRIGRGVRKFYSGVRDRKMQNAALSGTYVKFTQNSAIKNILRNLSLPTRRQQTFLCAALQV